MIKAFKTEVKLSPEQLQKLKQTIGVCRYVYNLYLSEARAHYKATGKFLSGYDFSKWLNNVHTQQQDTWIKDVSSKAVKQSIMNGERAYRNFFKGRARFPRFKKKRKQDVKAYFPKNNKTDWTVERHRVKIPTFGWIRLKELGYIPSDALVKSGTLAIQGNRAYVSVLCEVPSTPVTPPRGSGIGIDLGLKTYAVLSDGREFKGINKTSRIKQLEKKLKREQRALSRKYESKKEEVRLLLKARTLQRTFLESKDCSRD